MAWTGAAAATARRGRGPRFTPLRPPAPPPAARSSMAAVIDAAENDDSENDRASHSASLDDDRSERSERLDPTERRIPDFSH